PSTRNARKYAEIVADKSRRRRLSEVANKISFAAEENHDLAEIHDLAISLHTMTKSQHEGNRQRYREGGTFILDTPAVPPSVWGRDDEVLWARGEPLLIVGPPGVGKTTMLAQLAYGRVGLLTELLGMPVE